MNLLHTFDGGFSYTYTPSTGDCRVKKAYLMSGSTTIISAKACCKVGIEAACGGANAYQGFTVHHDKVDQATAK